MAILELPDELLLEIFNPLFTPPPWNQADATLPAAALAKVCRRFQRLATPGLYSHLQLDFANSPSSARLLHRTLSENYSFRPYCRVLHLVLPDPDGETAAFQTAMDMANDFATWLANTRELLVNGPFTHSNSQDAVWSLVPAAGRAMPKLGKLSLGPQVYIERVCEVLEEMKQLRTLQVGILALRLLNYQQVIPMPRREQIGCSSVTFLAIDYLIARPENLVPLLLLPARLEHFAFNGMAPGCYWAWPLQELITAVEPHQASLRTLRVASGVRMFNDDESLQDQAERLDLASFTELVGGVTFVDPPV